MISNTVLYETALKQYDTVAEILEIEDGIRERMRNPKRSLIVSVPVKKDEWILTVCSKVIPPWVSLLVNHCYWVVR